jgi:predicted nuclease with TOPRIM domain
MKGEFIAPEGIFDDLICKSCEAKDAEIAALKEQLEQRDGSTWKELNEHRKEAWGKYFEMKVQNEKLNEELHTLRNELQDALGGAATNRVSQG